MDDFTERAVDQVGKIETRGIGRIADRDRHGRSRELFQVWLTSNSAYVAILLGGSLVMMGLTVVQAFVVLLLGNMFWLMAGILAMSGPSSGTPGAIVTRALYGPRANRVFGAGITWLICSIYNGICLATGSLAGFAMVEFAGVPATGSVKIAIAVGVGLIALVLSLYGHATIVRFSAALMLVLGLCVLVLGVFVAQRASLHPAGHEPLSGGALWVALLSGFTFIAAAPLSWINTADYARYLPANTSKWRVAGWTAFGGWCSSTIPGGIGILAGTVVDMGDPQVSMRSMLPAWFYGLFLLMVIGTSIANTVNGTYSSGLSLQAMGLRTRRSRSVLIDAFLVSVLCLYALLAAHFLTALNNIMALTVTFLGPAMTIYAVDVLLRGNRYDGRALHDERPGSPFWHSGGIGWSGTGALVVGTVAAMLCVSTKVFVGPVATMLGGADISALVGPVVAGAVYLAAHRHVRSPARVAD